METENASTEQSQEVQKAGFKRKPNDSLWNIGNNIDQEEFLRVKGGQVARGETKRARAATHYHQEPHICYDHNVQNFLHRLSAVQNVCRIFAMQKAVLYSYAAERYFSKGVWGIPNTEPTRTIEAFKEILRKYSTPNAEASYLHNITFHHVPIQRFASFRWPETVEVEGDLDDDLDELEAENEEDEATLGEVQIQVEAEREKVSSTDGQDATAVADEAMGGGDGGGGGGSLQDLEVGTSSDAKVKGDVPTSGCGDEMSFLIDKEEKNIKPDIKANYLLK